MPSQSLPSPTLTNPDMILPYGDYHRASTPSPPPQAMRPPSPPGTQGALSSHPPYVRLSRAPSGRRATSASMTPPMEQYDHGSELSDIEEVDTTPTDRRSRELGPGPAGGDQITHIRKPASLASLMQQQGHSKRKYLVLDGGERGDDGSVHSASPSLAASDGLGPVSGFDDDDETVDGDRTPVLARDAEADADPTSRHTAETAPSDQRSLHTDSVIMEEADGDDQTSAALSTRAERILANAKKRLDNMEGNLSRARHSLIISPSPSMSPSLPASPPWTRTTAVSPHADERRIYPAMGVSPARHRQLHPTLPSSTGSPGHARVFSETSVPSSLHSSDRSSRKENEFRARSAADGIMAARSRKAGALGLAKSTSLREVRNTPSIRNDPQFWHVGTRNYLSRPSPGPEKEDLGRGAHGSHGLDPQPPSDDGYSDPDDVNPPPYGYHAGLARSQSTIQMRDVRDQMKDLKGRISSLQQRAREDNLRRRSTQSLRTPSPFTAAEQWYLGSSGYRDGGLGARPPAGKGPRRIEIASSVEGEIVDAGDDEPDLDDEPIAAGRYEDAQELQQTRTHAQGGHDDPDDYDLHPQTDGEDAETWQGDYLEEYDGSAEAAEHDVVGEDVSGPVAVVDAEEEEEVGTVEEDVSSDGTTSPPVGERHEDRADAFDYQHFYLHSGMGNYSQQELEWRNSTGSYGSTESVETARAVEASPRKFPKLVQPRLLAKDDEQRDYMKLHQRQMSTDSISTVATFATATEGQHSDEEEEEEEEEEEVEEGGDEERAALVRAMGLPPQQAPNGISRHPVNTDGGVERGSDRPHTPTWLGDEPSSDDDLPTPTKGGVNARRPAQAEEDFYEARSTDALPLLPSRAVTLDPSHARLLRKDDRAQLSRIVERLNQACLDLHVDGDGGDDEDGDATSAEGSRMRWRNRLKSLDRFLDVLAD
ncbi:MAG: hypothetical protein M1832_005082 [Thelocarpon impressellum]|nr:MAG: hypothetical protein M1832_005082 [Thelocarpon impressellum]